MSLLSKLGLGPKEVVDAAATAIERGADVVERWNPSERAKHDMERETTQDSAKSAAEARTYDPRTEVQGQDIYAHLAQMVNVCVDAMNRLVRPTLAYTLMGSLFGWWSITLNTTDPLMVELSIGVFGFYFGVRGLTEDLPKLIKSLAGLRRGQGK